MVLYGRASRDAPTLHLSILIAAACVVPEALTADKIVEVRGSFDPLVGIGDPPRGERILLRCGHAKLSFTPCLLDLVSQFS